MKFQKFNQIDSKDFPSKEKFIEKYCSPILHVRAQKLRKPSLARRGMPKLPAGTIVYVIPYSNGKYFTYGYTNKETAEKVRKNLANCDLDFNSIAEVQVISQLTPDKV